MLLFLFQLGKNRKVKKEEEDEFRDMREEVSLFHTCIICLCDFFFGFGAARRINEFSKSLISVHAMSESSNNTKKK